MRDHVDLILAQWRAELPALDAAPMGVAGRIARLALLLQRELEPVFARHGLNGGEFDVLAALRRAGKPFRLSPATLSRSMMVTTGGMSKRLSALEQAGLVRRVPAPDDGRSRLVELTADGRKLVEAVVHDHVANERRLLSALAAAESRQLAALLRKLAVSLGDATGFESGGVHRRRRRGLQRTDERR